MWLSTTREVEYLGDTRREREQGKSREGERVGRKLETGREFK